jgi:hypothetical protein
LYADRRKKWYDARRTIELQEGNTMFQTSITPPAATLPIPPNSEAQRINARLDAAAEAAYILDAVRR